MDTQSAVMEMRIGLRAKTAIAFAAAGLAAKAAPDVRLRHKWYTALATACGWEGEWLLSPTQMEGNHLQSSALPSINPTFRLEKLLPISQRNAFLEGER
jgi:hypothetical protein